MNLWNKLNYKMRLYMLVMVFTWIVAFVFFGIFYYREKEFKAETLNAHLQIYNAQLLSALDVDFEKGEEYINYVLESDSVRFTILDTAGVVIYDTQGVKAGTLHSDRLEIQKAIKNGQGFTQSRLSTSNDMRPYFYSAMKNDKYIVRTSLPYDMTLQTALQSESVYLWTLLIISVALSVLAFFATRQFGHNVARLRDFATLAERGELAELSSMNFPGDELGEISKHIINIYNKSQCLIKERDLYYQNLIDEEHEKARIKHQLTNNINHELRTPVHAIHGCIETIIDNHSQLTKEQILDFIEKAHGQVERLGALLNDISLITRITDAPQQIFKENIDIVSILDEIQKEVEMFPVSQQMRLNITVPTAMPICANRSLLESIFLNLVNNSLSYSGGRDIFISLIEENSEMYKFSYSDNGIGLDEAHFPRIFERFYRIDDGRSRKKGGTGLGLAIVKNAVLFHGGEISIKSRDGGGLEFIFTLSKN